MAGDRKVVRTRYRSLMCKRCIGRLYGTPRITADVASGHGRWILLQLSTCGCRPAHATERRMARGRARLPVQDMGKGEASGAGVDTRPASLLDGAQLARLFLRRGVRHSGLVIFSRSAG